MIAIAKIFETNVSLRNLALSLRKLPFSRRTPTQKICLFGELFLFLGEVNLVFP
jgi:hypothetical protein